jgi:hypothetical protein
MSLSSLIAAVPFSVSSPRAPRLQPRAPLASCLSPLAAHPLDGRDTRRPPSHRPTTPAPAPRSSSPSRRSAVEDGHPSGGFPTSIICSSTTQQPWRRRAGGARPRGHDARDWRAGPVAPAGTRGREEITGARGDGALARRDRAAASGAADKCRRGEEREREREGERTIYY